MKNTIKRILVFLLALTLCRGPAVTVVYAQGVGEQAAEAVDTEEFVAETESAEAPDDGAESLEQPDADTENTEESADGEEDGEPIAEESGENTDGAARGADTEQETIVGEEQPTETADEDIVYTEGALYDWCSSHRNSGGRVTLGGNITITETISISGGNGHVVIDTGQYGLVYDGGCISLASDLEIIGEGVDVPVLDIQTVIQYGYFWEPGWNDVVRELNITATGRDGTGGVAVRVRQDDGYSARYSSYSIVGLIRSYGTESVGLYLDEPLNAYCFQIEVEGEGSSAVYAPQGANLYYCKLKAQGAGASVVSGSGEIVVDTCATSPEPQEVQVINYRIIGVSGSRLYYPVMQYGDIDYLDDYITFLLSGGDGHPSVTEAFSISWEYDFIDTGVLGKTAIQGSLLPPFQGLGLEDDFPLELIVDVRSPDIPCISGIWFKEDMELGSYVYLTFWDTYERDDENVILWRSDDGGETWYDFTDSPDIEWFGSSICCYYGEISDTVMLQLEVLGKGESNVVSMYSVDGKVCGGNGGDRDGGDRKTVSGISNGNSTDVGSSTEGEDSSGDDNSSGGGKTSGSNNGTGSGISSGDNDPSTDGNSSGNGNSTGDGGSSGSGSGDTTDGSSSTGDNTSENDHSSGSGDTSGSRSKTDNKNDSDSGDKADTAISTNSTRNDSGLISVSEGITQETVPPPEEWEDGDAIAISGRRLAAMIEANPKAVTFIKNGIQISIAPADLLALGLGENELFLVEIKKLTGNSFSVLFKADDIELSDLPFVAYIGEAVFDSVSLASVVCVDENGDVLPSEYDLGTGKLSVSMTGPGVFTLQAEVQTEAAAVLVRDNGGIQKQQQGGTPGEASSPLNTGMIVAGICAIFLTAGSFAWRKRRLARR